MNSLVMVDDLQQCDTATLREMLSTAMQDSADAIRRLAMIVRELESRGEDLSGLRIGIVNHLRRIAYGQTIPEVVLRFMQYPLLLKFVGSLPLPDQEQLATGVPVPLAFRTDTGVDHRLVDPLDLTGVQVRQVFVQGAIRSPEQQVAYLEVAPKPTTAKKLSNGSCRPDRERGGLRVGRKFLPLSDVLETVAELRGTGVETVVDTPVSVPVKLTHDEHRMLKVRAAQSGCSISDLVRRALYAAGVATQYTAIT